MLAGFRLLADLGLKASLVSWNSATLGPGKAGLRGFLGLANTFWLSLTSIIHIDTVIIVNSKRGGSGLGGRIDV